MCVCHDVMQFELQNTTFSTYELSYPHLVYENITF